MHLKILSSLLIALLWCSTAFSSIDIKPDESLENQYKELELKALGGDIESQYSLFLMVIRNEPHLNHHASNAFKQIISAAQSGHTNAQFTIGSLYQTGHIVKKDVDVALSWLKEAASKEHVDAQYLVGSNYFSRRKEAKGAKRDEYVKQAEFWYEKAIDNGNLNALWQLGLLLVTTEENVERGKELIRNAASKSDKRAMYFAAINYKHLWLKSGKKSDFDKAIKWFEKSANLGHADSANELKGLIKSAEKTPFYGG